MLPLESDTIVPIAVLPRVPAVVPRGRGHFGKMLRDYRGSGSQDDGDGMGMRMNFAGSRGSGIGLLAHALYS